MYALQPFGAIESESEQEWHFYIDSFWMCTSTLYTTALVNHSYDPL